MRCRRASEDERRGDGARGPLFKGNRFRWCKLLRDRRANHAIERWLELDATAVCWQGWQAALVVVTGGGVKVRLAGSRGF